MKLDVLIGYGMSLISWYWPTYLKVTIQNNLIFIETIWGKKKRDKSTLCRLNASGYIDSTILINSTENLKNRKNVRCMFEGKFITCLNAVHACSAILLKNSLMSSDKSLDGVLKIFEVNIPESSLHHIYCIVSILITYILSDISHLPNHVTF